MKALSIRQPWTWAILHAGKRVENRSRRFNYRGPILLHASINIGSFAEWNGAHEFILETSGKRPIADQVCRGGIVGRADIVDCIEEGPGDSKDPWFFGPFGLVLDNVEPIPFLPFKGMLGLFEVPDRLVRRYA